MTTGTHTCVCLTRSSGQRDIRYITATEQNFGYDLLMIALRRIEKAICTAMLMYSNIFKWFALKTNLRFPQD